MRRQITAYMLGVLAGLVLGLCVGKVHATELNPQPELVLHGFSYHFGAPANGVAHWNQRNIGLGARVGFDAPVPWAIQAGTFNNSHERRSRYLIAEVLPVSVLGVQVGAFAGTTNGYPRHHYSYGLAAGAVARIEVQRLSLSLRYIPPGVPKITSVISLELGVRF
jgi:hypothetical protein